MNRRHFVKVAALTAIAAGCSDSITGGKTANAARLKYRPKTVARTLPIGLSHINLTSTSFVAYVPPGAMSREKMALMIFLHGATRNVEGFMDGFKGISDLTGAMVVAPYAVQGTWDAIGGVFGPDVAAIDEMLSRVFNTITIDPARIGLSGFSDGATYSLALGLANGDLFSRVIAYSPSHLIPVPTVGHPAVTISHGVNDLVIPYATSHDETVPRLIQQGYTVDFETFSGGHAVPSTVVETQMRLLAGEDSPLPS